jgi:uncharacterized glyoxalase superfamily protein PhnB
MSYDPAKGFPRVVAELYYKDVRAAVDWLSRAFGLRERLRVTREDGVVVHVDMDLEGGVVMLAAGEGRYENPASLGQTCCSLVFFVDDVERHFQQACAAGAKILFEPTDRPWGLRQYRAQDLEGHTWEFSRHLRDVPPEQWGATVEAPRGR